MVLGEPLRHLRVPHHGEPVVHREDSGRDGTTGAAVEHGDDADAWIGAQLPGVPGAGQQVRPGRHPEVQHVVERVVPHQGPGVPTEVRRHGVTDPVREQPVTEEHDDRDRPHDEGYADDRELGEPEVAHPALLGGLRDHDVDGASGEQQQSACTAREGQRHQQPRRLDRPPQGHHDRHREQRRHGTVEPDQRGEAGTEQHGEQQQPVQPGARPADQGLTDPGRHPGGVQALAHDEQRGDQDDRWVAEPGERLGQGQDPESVESQRGPHRDELHRPAVEHEQRDDRCQGEQRQGRVAHSKVAAAPTTTAATTNSPRTSGHTKRRYVS